MSVLKRLQQLSLSNLSLSKIRKVFHILFLSINWKMKWNVRFFLKNFRKKTKSKDKKRVAIIVRKRDEKTSRRNRLDIKKSRKNRKKKWHQRKSKKKRHQKESKKKTTSDNFEIENFTKSKTEFRFFFSTEKRKDTNIETLKRLTMIVTVLAKLYFSTDDIAEIIDESDKRKRRILTQVSEIFTKLSKRWLSFVRDFYFHDKENNDNNDLDLFFHKFNENFWERQKKSKKNFDFNEDFKTIKKTFSFFFTHDERKKKLNLNN